MHLGRAIAPETFRVEAPTDAAEGDAVRVRVIEVHARIGARPSRFAPTLHRDGRRAWKAILTRTC